MGLRVQTALFGGTKILENHIDEFHDRVSEAGLVFKKAVRLYLDQGASEDYRSCVEHISNIEDQADQLRRRIEAQLYVHDLIPDLRADVLDLVEHLDRILGMYEANAYRLDIEKPVLFKDSYADFEELVEIVTTCMEKAILASRAFFRDFNAVRDHNHKVMYYESEADRVSSKLKRVAFDSKISLAKKLHIRSFVDHIDAIANEAEDLADKLAIFTIKRSL